jgi:acyl-CoA reductase-like NAD-dependent aldehyde dehydrogenase
MLTEMGPLCTLGQVEHIERQVALAIEEGGKLLCGGRRLSGPGLFFEPTIIECPRQDMTIVDTELFGPVLAVQRFRTEAEVLEMANDTKHGLAGGAVHPRWCPAIAFGKSAEIRDGLGQHLTG